MTRSIQILLGSAILLLLATPALAEEQKPVIAVSPLAANGVNANDASAIAENLTTHLQQTGKFRVMERGQVAHILQEQSFQQSGACSGGDCTVEVGRMLGVDQMLVGSVSLVGSTYSLNLRLVSISTGEALKASALTRKGTIDDVLTDLVPRAVAELTQTGPASTSPASVAQESSTPAKTRIWPWILGGAAVAGGGVAAVLLLHGSSGDAQPTTTTVHASW